MANTRLFVGNIPYTASEEDLRGVFSRTGGVQSVRIITDFDTGRSKGYGFVEMASSTEADAAIKALHNYNLNGRTLVVNEARPRAQSSGQPGARAR
jgi:RNA recognition motif-containing protein